VRNSLRPVDDSHLPVVDVALDDRPIGMFDSGFGGLSVAGP